MRTLNDAQLIECYQLSLQWSLDEDFIVILRQEIDRRNLEVEQHEPQGEPELSFR